MTATRNSRCKSFRIPLEGRLHEFLSVCILTSTSETMSACNSSSPVTCSYTDRCVICPNLELHIDGWSMQREIWDISDDITFVIFNCAYPIWWRHPCLSFKSMNYLPTNFFTTQWTRICEDPSVDAAISLLYSLVNNTFSRSTEMHTRLTFRYINLHVCFSLTKSLTYHKYASNSKASDCLTLSLCLLLLFGYGWRMQGYLILLLQKWLCKSN